ncbi:hypothetical protein Pcinc_009962 [Petrolisthes cinctipes]|uniref:Uncharacterized protein n=1 Tax=Petrolisthes cinctipes TaxID=88211 RepID=A0AAE1KXW1_PETCI|nr:hypothetical protein Pcinc_009962 [Petrolisthes cinctipes]
MYEPTSKQADRKAAGVPPRRPAAAGDVCQRVVRGKNVLALGQRGGRGRGPGDVADQRRRNQAVQRCRPTGVGATRQGRRGRRRGSTLLEHQTRSLYLFSDTTPPPSHHQ